MDLPKWRYMEDDDDDDDDDDDYMKWSFVMLTRHQINRIGQKTTLQRADF